jgi:dTDP-glucose 4,6-dehydratase
VDRSIQDASPFISTNVGGVQVLLDAVKDVCPQSRFIQVGTDEAYGSADDGEPFTESSPIKPSSPYAASKAAGDLLALAYARTFGMNVIVTRCSNNYGPRQFPEKLVPLAISNMLLDKKVPVYGSGKQKRDWIHVDDHCSGILCAIFRGTSGEVYNFGTRRATENIEIIKKLIALCRSRCPAYKTDSEIIEYVKDRPGHDTAYVVDAAKARKALAWRPNIMLPSGLDITAHWYFDNSEWWSNVRSGDYLKYYEKQYGRSA